jgi:hypothetical protein
MCTFALTKDERCLTIPVDSYCGTTGVLEVIKGHDLDGIEALLSVYVVSNLAHHVLAAVWHVQNCAVPEAPYDVSNPLSRTCFGHYVEGISLGKKSGQLN